VKFAKKYGLSYPLLSDEKKETSKLTVCGKKNLCTVKKYFGIERTTVVIDENGMFSRSLKR